MRVHRGQTRWRIDWRGEGSPEVGHLVRYVTPTSQCSYARVTSVRVIRNRNPLPPDVLCRYAVTVRRFDDKPAGEAVSWTCYAHAKPKRKPLPIDVNPWLPPL
jgi:hypothetical protein